MADYHIDCINKYDRQSSHERISHVGGPSPEGTGRWKDTTDHIVAFIEAKTHRFYTNDGRNTAWVGVRTSVHGHKFS